MSHSTTTIIDGQYAAGLEWVPMVTGSTLAAAQARARDGRASMFVHEAGKGVVGLAFLSRKPKEKVFSLAALAARAYQSGEWIFAVELPPESEVDDSTRWWVGSVGRGVPAADEVHASIEEVDEALRRLRKRHPTAGFAGDTSVAPVGCQSLTLEQIGQVATESAALIDVRRKVPPWAFLAVIALLVPLAWGELTKLYKQHFGRVAPQAAAVQVDPVAEWTKASEAWVVAQKGATGSDLEVVRRAIHAVPLEVGGWNLTAIDCLLAASWVCTANYARPIAIEDFSTNRTFEQAREKLRPDWKVQWKGPAEAIVAWEVLGSLVTTLVPQLHTKALAAYQVETFSEFQELIKVWNKVDVGEMVLAAVAAPVVDGAAVPRPAPELVPEFWRAPVNMQGPLRNLELAESMLAPVFWREVHVTRAKDAKPGLYTSEFMVVMRGEIYAQTKGQPK